MIHAWTRADLVRLPDDGNRYEVLDGELFVTPQARYDHQRIATRLVMYIAPYVERHHLGSIAAPGAVIFGKNELQPGVQVIPGPSDWPRGTEWKDLPKPILVIEVLSDSTSRRDLGVKREAYRRLGIETYWVIDERGERVLAFSPDSDEPLMVTDALRWQPRPELPPLEIPLESILPQT